MPRKRSSLLVKKLSVLRDPPPLILTIFTGQVVQFYRTKVSSESDIGFVMNIKIAILVVERYLIQKYSIRYY